MQTTIILIRLYKTVPEKHRLKKHLTICLFWVNIRDAIKKLCLSIYSRTQKYDSLIHIYVNRAEAVDRTVWFSKKHRLLYISESLMLNSNR